MASSEANSSGSTLFAETEHNYLELAGPGLTHYHTRHKISTLLSLLCG